MLGISDAFTINYYLLNTCHIGGVTIIKNYKWVSGKGKKKTLKLIGLLFKNRLENLARTARVII